MTGSVHAALGAAIGRLVKNPPLAFGAGVLSHWLGDITPHHDVGPIETPLVFGTVFYLGRKHGWSSPQFWGALGGICPDFEHIPAVARQDPRRHRPMEEKIFPTHNGRINHAEWPFNKTLGVLVQILLFLGGLYLAGTFHRDS